MFPQRHSAIGEQPTIILLVRHLRYSDMVQKLSNEVRECYAHAKDCARKAAAQLEPALRQAFLDAEQCWLRLVRRLASGPELEGD